MTLADDRLFDPDPAQKSAAIDLYRIIKDLPIVSPHGHVDPSLFSEPDHRFGNPVELLIQPDHYVLRMFASQGIPYELVLSKANPRQAWKIFAKNFYLFRGTPSGLWLAHELESLFDVQEKLGPNTADLIYDHIEALLSTPAFSPRALYERLHIEVLATTDGAADKLEHHQAIRNSGWPSRIIPTFRPDGITNLHAPGWRKNIDELSDVSSVDITSYPSFVVALEQRRDFFRSMGATATDTSPFTPDSTPLDAKDADAIFQTALRGEATTSDAARFAAHMLFEMARMSVEDGLVMQLHPGVYRNHNQEIFSNFGADRGFDIPVTAEFTRNLRPLLDKFGNHPNFHLLLFTLDEATYTRELAPLAGAYPSVKLGPPWWFHDSWNGMRRYFDQVMETAGMYNTSGFNDDTRTLLAIPARHDVWRRSAANWVAGLFVRKIVDRADAESMVVDLAVGLAKKAYRL